MEKIFKKCFLDITCIVIYVRVSNTRHEKGNDCVFKERESPPPIDKQYTSSYLAPHRNPETDEEDQPTMPTGSEHVSVSSLRI